MQRWRGLKALVQDGVEHGSRAVERVHLGIARRSFLILEAIPPIAVPAKGVHEIHDAVVANAHGMIRLVNRVAGDTLGRVLDVVEKRRGDNEATPPAPDGERPSR